MTLADGRRIAWCEYGDPVGSPVLYCHGVPGSRREHPPATEAAARRNLRFIVVDRPGYGRTTRLPGHTLADATADIAALADKLDLSTFDVLGFSGGGPYAQALAALRPERVRRLYLVSSWAPFDLAGKAGMAEAYQQLWDLCAEDFQAFSRTLQQAVDEAGGPYELLLGGALESDQVIFRDTALAAAYRTSTEEAVRQDLTGMLEDAAALTDAWPFRVDSITCPTHLWHGTLDVNAPIDMGRWLAEHIPGAQLTEWSDAAHFEMFRRWDEVLDTVTAH